MKRFLLFAVVLLTLLSAGAADRAAADGSVDDKTVGVDVLFEDIADFYYTYDASTALPHYQRYRFYVAEGKRYFYHETREGGGWPQTEADITTSGTVALTEVQWAAFCGLLDGGTARVRVETLDDGDAGPWLFIYWQGGETEGRAFHFADNDRELAFETYCAALAGNPGEHLLTRFFFSIWGEMRPRTWEITRTDDGWLIREDEETPRPFPETLVPELTRIITEYGADSWQGVYSTEYEVLDGECFSLELTYADGVTVSASGDNAFPEGYSGFRNAILDILERE